MTTVLWLWFYLGWLWMNVFVSYLKMYFEIEIANKKNRCWGAENWNLVWCGMSQVSCCFALLVIYYMLADITDCRLTGDKQGVIYCRVLVKKWLGCQFNSVEVTLYMPLIKFMSFILQHPISLYWRGTLSHTRLSFFKVCLTCHYKVEATFPSMISVIWLCGH